MTYHAPFTQLQYRHAVEVYNALRSNHRLLRLVYAPADSEERAMLRCYRDAIYAFGSELRKPLHRILPDALNDSEFVAKCVFAEYAALKAEKGLRDEA